MHLANRPDPVHEREHGISISSTQFQRVSHASVGIGGNHYQLLEIDAEGLTVLLPPDKSLPGDGESVDWSIVVNDETISLGRAAIGNRSTRRSGVALRLVPISGVPDPGLLEASRSLARLRDTGTEDTDLVPTAYKILCTDIVSLLRSYRRLAQQLDARAGADERTVDALFEQTAKNLAADWAAVSKQAADLSLPLLNDADRIREMRAYTQRTVTPELAGGPIWQRAFEKPRGYPGDYGVMNYCYAPERLGDTSYDRLCHRLGLDFVACVRTRKDVLRDFIRDRLVTQSPLRTMSIACGSAHEIFELASASALSGQLESTLVDQDPEALDFAMSRLQRFQGKGLTARTVRAQFGDYSDPNGNALPGGQDLVYCFGMFDYLPDALVEGIVPVLYSKLEPGGTLIVGNLRPAPEMIWPLCFVLGYDMWFRTAEQLRALGTSLPGCRAELKLEPTGYNYLLFLHRS